MTDETDVPLDPAMIKVLASDTRLDILKQLNQRRMTLTELSNALGLKKATILEHLERLTSAGLVRRMDDGERLWVYYELTRRGGYVVNPGRTRFYLLVAGSALAGAVAVAVALVFLAGHAPGPAPPGEGVFHVAESQAISGDVLHASVGPGFVGPTQAFLVPANEARALRAGQPGILGIPLEQHDAAGVLELRPSVPVATGTYSVYVQDAHGHTNAASMPQVFLQAYEAQVRPQVWWQGLDADAHAQVQLGGSAALGTVLVVPAANSSADALLAVPLRDGNATLGAPALDQAQPGTYRLYLLRPDNVSVPLAAQFEVRAPGVAIAPLSILAGQQAAFDVSAWSPGSTPEVPVRAGGVLLGTVRGAGQVQLNPQTPGSVDLAVGRAAHRTLLVLPDLRPAFDILANGTWQLALADGKGPARDVAVLLDGAALGTTDSDGRLAIAAPANGTHSLELRAPGAPPVLRGIAVQGSAVQDAPPAVSVRADGPRDVGVGGFTLDAHLANDAALPVRVTLAVTVDGALAASQAVQLAAHGTADATLRIVAEGGAHEVVVQALLPPMPASAGSAVRPPSSGSASTGGPPASGATSGDDADGIGAAAMLRVEVPPMFAAEKSFAYDAYTGLQPIPGTSDARSMAKTPGFELALVGLGLLAALAMRRRR